jgi:hypothetical protein
MIGYPIGTRVVIDDRERNYVGIHGTIIGHDQDGSPYRVRPDCPVWFWDGGDFIELWGDEMRPLNALERLAEI